MVVASNIEGRLRIRDDRLRNQGVLAEAEELLAAQAGVIEVQGNQRVGSLLILYSSPLAQAQELVDAVAALIGSEAQELAAAPAGTGRWESCFGKLSLPSLSLPPRIRRNLVNLGMLASLLLSLAAAVLDLKKLHILAGIVFVAIFGDHLFERKQLIFT